MARDAYLIRRGNQFYLRLAIPRSIRSLFPSKTGKPRDFIAEPLGRNYDPARVECDRRVADYRALFARAASMTPKAVQDEIDAIKQRAEGRRVLADLPMLQTEIERIRQETKRRAEEVLNDPGHDEEMRRAQELVRHGQRELWARTVERITGGAIPKGPAWDPIIDRLTEAQKLGWADVKEAYSWANPWGEPVEWRNEQAVNPTAETITQAAEAWVSEMQRDPSAAVRPATLDGHRLRVRAFVEHCGDAPLASVTRAMANDFLTAMANGRSNRTVNNYATTLAGLFKSARYRGRFPGDNPFEGQKRKAGGERREAFTATELHKIFASLPPDIAPAKHSPETALPWAVRIAAYTGMRLEEISQLTVADIQTRGSNGGTVIVFDIHNGDSAHQLKNDSSARAIPVHSELARAGLLDYIRALPQDGLLFPGLKRRASKGGKIGARLGELFRKKLVKLGMKRDGLCFHSFRHTVAQRLEAAAVSQTDAARVTGHTIEGMTYGVHSTGPGLKRLAAVVEAVRYDEQLTGI